MEKEVFARWESWKADIRRREAEQGLINLAFQSAGENQSPVSYLKEGQNHELLKPLSSEAAKAEGSLILISQDAISKAERKVLEMAEKMEDAKGSSSQSGEQAGSFGFSAEAEEAAHLDVVLPMLARTPWKGTAIVDGGGLDPASHLWLRLPEGISADALLRASLLEGAAFLPGTLAFVQPPAEAGRLIRLNVAGCRNLGQLSEGMDRIAAALGAFTARLDQG